MPQLLDELRAEPGNTMKKYRAVFAHRVGVSWDANSTFNSQQNIATISAMEWARGHLNMPSHR